MALFRYWQDMDIIDSNNKAIPPFSGVKRL